MSELKEGGGSLNGSAVGPAVTSPATANSDTEKMSMVSDVDDGGMNESDVLARFQVAYAAAMEDAEQEGERSAAAATRKRESHDPTAAAVAVAEEDSIESGSGVGDDDNDDSGNGAAAYVAFSIAFEILFCFLIPGAFEVVLYVLSVLKSVLLMKVLPLVGTLVPVWLTDRDNRVWSYVVGAFVGENGKSSAGLHHHLYSNAWPPPALVLLAVLTVFALIVHPDGYTWILLRKIRCVYSREATSRRLLIYGTCETHEQCLLT